jgi:hypothetical protein
LKQGQNTIQRKSIDFQNVADDPVTVGKLNGGNLNRVNLRTQNNNNGFPHRLILPKGSKGGQDFTLFVTINELSQDNNGNHKNNKNIVNDSNDDDSVSEQNDVEISNSNSDENQEYQGNNNDLNNGDKRALGFPLDRNIQDVNGFVTDNTYFKDVSIYQIQKQNN